MKNTRAQSLSGKETLVTGRRVNPESGYALLFAVFLAATMFLLAAVATPSILNDGRRQREQQLIWRGNQYVRAIRLYYQKNGRFPQTKDELIKGNLSVHYLRKKFTDPISSDPDDWRMIYVNPSGQLIGSVRYHTLQEMAIQQGANSQTMGQFAALFGGAPAGQAQTPASAGVVGARGGPAAAGAAGTAGARGGPVGAGRGGATTNGTGSTTGTQTADSQNSGSGTTIGSSFGQPTPVQLQAVDGPVMGGSMIGIASKVKKDSLMVYQGKDNYFEWEFIWNPLLNRGPGGTPPPQQSVAIGAPNGALPPPPGLPGTAMPGMGLPTNGMPGSGAPPNQQMGPAPGQIPGPGSPAFPPDFSR